MKNILDEKPSEELIHRLAYAVAFVKEEDVKNKKMLDIGCGYGWFELNALKRGVKEIIGVEPLEADLTTAKKNVIKSNITFHVGSTIDLPFENKSFDTVVSWDVIEHIPKHTEHKMFSEIRRVLKDGGVFYLSTPNKHMVSNIFDPAWWLIGHRHYSYKDLACYAKNNELKLEAISIKGGWWLSLGISNFYVAKWIFRKGLLFENFFCKKIDLEFNSDKGFVELFCKFRAV